MSEFKITQQPNGKKFGQGVIEGVTFCYIKLQEGGFKYGSKTEREYSVDCVVDKATAKAFKKAFPKNGYKEVDTAEFKDKFRIDPPLPDEDEQFVIKLKTPAQNKDGEVYPYEYPNRPKMFIPEEDGVGDVTMSMLAANGSKGDVAFSITENDFGTFPKLTGILVRDMVEYESSGGSPFGNVVKTHEGTGEAQQKADVSTTDAPADDFSDDDDQPF